MADLETFRKETRAWLEANCPPEMRKPMTADGDTFWGGRNTKFSSDAQRAWFERMRDKGWTVPHWPKEYGGGGLDGEEAKIVRQEMAAISARQPLTSFGISMLGPALLKYGTEAQKKEHLPKITAGLIRWCQGYSEPNAGSDLASLQTRAVADGDDYIINGQKIWTSYANYADWIFCLVRTDPAAKKHDGISFILFDMASKGVSTKPILLISGRSPFCETFFDNVRVPKSHVVGTVNRDVEFGHRVDMLDRQAERCRGLLCPCRGRDATDRQLPAGQRGQQVSRCGSGAQTDGHAIFDVVCRRLRGQPLLELGVHSA